MCDFLETSECFQGVESYVLLQVFIVDWCACSFRRSVNECANFRRIKNHVTVFLGARLYLA